MTKGKKSGTGSTATPGKDVTELFNMSLSSCFGVSGKTVIVTGGSRGIGYMIASGFVQQGCKVYIFSRNPDHEAASSLNKVGPGSCKCMVCDVNDTERLKDVVKTVTEENPDGVHVLVNNSGATWGQSFEETTKASFDKLVNVNLTGLFVVTQAFTPLLEKAATNEDPSRVINIASIDGMTVPAFEEYAYTATKAAVIHLTRVMAGLLRHKHINFNSISPGLFPSKMADQVLKYAPEELVHGNIPMGRPGRPKEIFGAALFLASPAGTYTTGANLVVDGGITAKPRI